MCRLLSVNQDAKTIKGLKKGYLTGILYLMPDKKLCPCCTAGCRKACLVSAGHGRMSTVAVARLNKSKLFHKHFEQFKAYLIADIYELVDTAKKMKLKPCVRINGTSDIDVQQVFGDVLQLFKDVKFYDYTKVWDRVAYYSNYYLCYSRSETTADWEITDKLDRGYNVAVVFREVPETYLDHKVVRGDDSDLRFLDPKGVIVGLEAKAKAIEDATGFVV